MLKDVKTEYQKGGIKQVLIQTWRYVLLYSVLAPWLQRLFGRRIHEKLVRSVTIGYWPKIREPRTFNEKVMHRKLYTDEDIFATLEDKCAARDYVRNRVGEEVLNEIYCMTKDPDKIPFEDLPEQFVVKATHGSSWNLLIDDKSEANFERIKATCEDWLSRTYVPTANEYWYKDIEPRIIVEKYIDEEGQKVPRDFKFFVFHGQVKYIQVDFDRATQHKRCVFTPDWEVVDVRIRVPRGASINRPENLEEMIRIAERLGEVSDFIRVDLYNLDDETIVFGELTVAHGSGGNKFEPVEYDFEFGSHWKLK